MADTVKRKQTQPNLPPTKDRVLRPWAVYFDATLTPTPGGHACFGHSYEVVGADTVVMRRRGYLGHHPELETNSAELLSFYMVLRYLKRHHPDRPVVLHGDSDYVINLFHRNRPSPAVDDAMAQTIRACRDLLSDLPVLNLHVENSHGNRRADGVARSVMPRLEQNKPVACYLDVLERLIGRVPARSPYDSAPARIA